MNQSINNIDTQPQNPNIGENLGGDDTKMFTKEQVNKIVEERLKKERIKTGALKDMKDAVMNLCERGYFDKYKAAFGKNLSLSDMAGIMMEEINKLGATNNFENRQINPVNQLTKYTDTDTPERTIPQNSGLPMSKTQPPEWCSNPRIFELFAQNKNLPMENILNDYLKFVVQVEQSEQVRRANQIDDGVGDADFGDTINNNTEQILRTKNQNLNNAIRSGYNSISPTQSHRTGDNFALTERQKELARAGGMTYREYFEFINSIPTKKLKR